MLSKSLFDLDHSNAPVIRAEILSSQDVRDKIAKRFVESLGATSQWCGIQAISETEWMIFPIGPHELKAQAEFMMNVANEYESAQKQRQELIDSRK